MPTGTLTMLIALGIPTSWILILKQLNHFNYGTGI